MITPELSAYIQSCRASGISDGEIKQTLISQGWQETDINEGLTGVIQTASGLSPAGRFGFLKKIPVTSTQAWRYGKIVLVVVIVAVGIWGGFKSYSYFTNSPQKIWSDTSAKMLKITSVKFNLDASYSEQAPAGSDSTSGFNEFLGGSGGQIKLGVNGQGAAVFHADQSDADFDMTSTISVQLGSLNISLNFQSRKLGDIVYYKMGGNPLLGLFGGSSSSAQADQWLQTDLKSNDSTLSTVSQLQKNQILEAFKKAKLMQPTKLLGSEDVDGTATWHYTASLDKQELKNYITTVEQTIHTSDAQAQQVAAIIDKIEFKKLEIWIGKSDHLVRQVEIQSNAPGLIETSLDSARNKSRDAKRIADVRQLMTGLELFYNDNNRYPAAVNGQPSPSDGNTKFSTYLSAYPKSPTPADGSCTDSNNDYIYEQTNGGQNYKLTFCLGHDTGGYKAGVQQATTSGITTTIPSNLGADPGDLNAIQFTGAIELKLKLSEFNSKVKIDQPPGKITNVGAQARDARRLAEVRQMMTAFELFYNDKGVYPDALSQITPTYISVMPVAPTADGSCTTEQNNYQYQGAGKNYSLTFCLGDSAGGYSAGIHTLSPSGIK